MANMSYCRFHNTYWDFKKCVESLQYEVGINDLIENEKHFALKMRELCEQYLKLTETEEENE
jgi:hypothetical protein